MALGEIRQLIENRINSQWPAIGAISIPLRFNGVDPINAGDVETCVVYIVQGPSVNIGLNEAPTRTGTVSVMCYFEKGKGTKRGYELADYVKQVFENQRIGVMRMFETSVYDRGVSGNMHVFEATTNYEAEIA